MKKYTKWTIILFILASLIMAEEVLTVPDYRGGRSYVSYSPDGKYRLDHVYPKDNGRSVRVLTSLDDGKVKAIVPISIWFDIDVNPIFLCTDDNSTCYQHLLQTGEEIMYLPPSPWTRLHACLVLKLKHLEEPQLKIMEISKRYPPVTKKSITNQFPDQ